jgi:acetylornithine deacetylase/succinyl-diaminopimelate desuccinylase-like protein
MGGDELRDEVVALARDLIRLDTSNPPGNETPAAELLAEYLRGSGVESELIGPDPERLNLVARLEGSGSGPSLMLLAHTDVVPAPIANWTVDPFEGRIRDTALVGRGAVDMKNELAARAVAFAVAARSGERPPGDVVLVAESDEERNVSDVGMSWLVREHPELRCDYALNEGGGMSLELSDGRRLVLISVGEKQVTSLRIRVVGRAGHASAPRRADNPLRHVATAIDRLIDFEAPVRITPSTERALEVLGAESAEPGELERLSRLHTVIADLLPAMVRMTITPTGLQTHEPSNVIPPYAELICDCRTLPGEGEAEIREQVGRALGDGFDYELELAEPLTGGTESPIDTPLYRACEEYVAERLPGAELLPAATPGFTDSHWVRAAHGTVAYGFAPVFATDPIAYGDSAHGADEAIEIADLVEMTRFHLHAIDRLASA